jgi:hypothetical protein
VCGVLNPLTTILTHGKGQSPTNNAKLSHMITGHIIDPDSLSSTAHRIEICDGTIVISRVIDETGAPTNTAGGSLTCFSAGCSGIVTTKEKYRSVSEDGQDRDEITLIPRGGPGPHDCPCWTEEELDGIAEAGVILCLTRGSAGIIGYNASSAELEFALASESDPWCRFRSRTPVYTERFFVIPILDFFACRDSIIAECESRGVPIP